MVDVRNDYSRFQESHSEVVAIGMGTPEQTAEFRTSLGLPFVCLADPDRRAYRAYGLELGSFGQIAGVRIWAAGLKALLRGGAGKPVGDVQQLHGSFIIDQAGIVRYVHLPRHSADRPSNEELHIALASMGER